MDKNVSPNYSSGQMTYLEAEAGDIPHASLFFPCERDARKYSV